MYELMEGAWRPHKSGERPEWMDASEVAFSEEMDPVRKVVASTSPTSSTGTPGFSAAMWSTPFARLGSSLGRGALGGVALPGLLAADGLIDEFMFVLHLVVAGRGPRRLDDVDQSSAWLGGGSFSRVRRYRPA